MCHLFDFCLCNQYRSSGLIDSTSICPLLSKLPLSTTMKYTHKSQISKEKEQSSPTSTSRAAFDMKWQQRNSQHGLLVRR